MIKNCNKNEKSFHQGEGNCAPANQENCFDEASASVELLTNEAAEPDTAAGLPPLDSQEGDGLVMAFEHPVVDYVNTMLPDGVKADQRRRYAQKLADDLLLICDGDAVRTSRAMLQVNWVKEMVDERGADEMQRILETARKRIEKREVASSGFPMPSKDMRQAIRIVTGQKFERLYREAYLRDDGVQQARNDGLTMLLESFGRQIQKLLPNYELLRLMCYNQKLRHYVANLFLGGAFGMTDMTRCWYKSGMEPGRICRMNCYLELIGRSGSGKHIAVDRCRQMMEPVKKKDKAQIDALNRWNQEREQNGGGQKNKTPRPKGVFRCMPSETSAAAIREAEYNAVEVIDGEEWPLHIFHFNSELQDLQRQMKKDYLNIEKLFYKGFHNEPDGSYLKTSSAPVGEYNVHYNSVFTGTQSALEKQITPENFGGGLLGRLTVVPLGDSNFEMRERREYTEEDELCDQQLREWAYRLDSCKGEIPCKPIDIALDKWSNRRMLDAKEEHSRALEDLLKRPYWHGLNYSMPYIVARHWDKMVKDSDGRMKCGPDFKMDKTDVKLALLIVNAHYAFQKLFFLGVGEKYYDDKDVAEISNTHHQQKTLLAYRRLPKVFTSADVDQAYGYGGNTGSICSRLKRLKDDGLIQKIRTGEDKGKYRKLV